MTPTGTPLPAAATGTERWQRSVARERILQELHALALDGTLRSTAPLPTPEEFEAWAKDLRRSRLSIPGGFIRWTELLRKRHHPRARELGQRVLDLMQQLLDLDLPLVRSRVAEAPGSATATWKPIDRPLAAPQLAAPELPTPAPLSEQEILSVVARRQKVHVLRPTLATKTAGGR